MPHNATFATSKKTVICFRLRNPSTTRNMKRIFILFLFLIALAFSGFSQGSNLVVFTENGERFYLIINGVRQNDEAQTNVRVTGLTAPSYKVKIIFENPGLKSLDKTIYFAEDEEVEATYVIKRDRKNRLVLRFMNQAPLPAVVQPQPNQFVIPYHTSPLPPSPPTNILPQNQGESMFR